MPYYAQLNNGAVVAVTETHTPLGLSDDLVEIDGLHADLLGKTYDRAARFFVAPAPQPEQRQITKLAFRNRFTRAEKATLEIAALDDPAAPMAQRQQSAALRADLKDQESATFIDLDRADTRAGVQALEAAGLLAAGRALEILDAPVQPHERPQG